MIGPDAQTAISLSVGPETDPVQASRVGVGSPPAADLIAQSKKAVDAAGIEEEAE